MYVHIYAVQTNQQCYYLILEVNIYVFEWYCLSLSCCFCINQHPALVSLHPVNVKYHVNTVF